MFFLQVGLTRVELEGKHFEGIIITCVPKAEANVANIEQTIAKANLCPHLVCDCYSISRHLEFGQ